MAVMMGTLHNSGSNIFHLPAKFLQNVESIDRSSGLREHLSNYIVIRLIHIAAEEEGMTSFFSGVAFKKLDQLFLFPVWQDVYRNHGFGIQKNTGVTAIFIIEGIYFVDQQYFRQLSVFGYSDVLIEDVGHSGW